MSRLRTKEDCELQGLLTFEGLMMDDTMDCWFACTPELDSRASMIFALPSAPSWMLGQTEQYCAERFADHWVFVPRPLVCHSVEHALGLLPQAAASAGLPSLASNNLLGCA